MLSPAFEMQYSARFTEAAYAETEVMKTIRPHPRSSIQPAASAVRNCGPFKVGDDQLVEALLGGLQLANSPSKSSNGCPKSAKGTGCTESPRSSFSIASWASA